MYPKPILNIGHVYGKCLDAIMTNYVHIYTIINVIAKMMTGYFNNTECRGVLFYLVY